MIYSKEDGLEICKKLNEIFLLRGVREGYSETLLAEKLSNPIIIQELARDQDLGEGDYINPLVGTEFKRSNYNTQLPTSDKYKKLEEAKDAEKQKALEMLEGRIKDMKRERAAVPTTVNHDKDMSHRVDIIVPSVTMIVGGKTLLEGAFLKLAYG